MNEVTIIGLGHIGSSLGAALIRHAQIPRVTGISRTEATARTALERKAAHETMAGLSEEAVRRSDLIVLATPVRTILQILPRIAPWVAPKACVLDVGSTKEEIMAAAAAALNPPPHFVGGHPMAGTDRSGPESCDPELFRNRPFILIPPPADPTHWPATLTRMIESIGARPVIMTSAREHDRAVAMVSHVPYLLSYAITLASRDERTRDAEFPLSISGNSFRDATRVAMSQPDMVMDFLLTNREELKSALDRFLSHLESLRDALDNESELRVLLDKARILRQRLSPP